MPLPNSNNSNNKKGPIKFSMYWMYALVLVFIAGVYFMEDKSITKEVSYSDFEKYVEQDHGITKIIVYSDKKEAEGFLSDSLASALLPHSQFEPGKGAVPKVITDIPSADKISSKIEEWQRQGAFKGEVKYEKSGAMSSILWTYGPFLLLIVFWFYIMRRMSGGGGAGGGGGVFSVGKSKAQLFDKDNAVKVTFKDVAGLSEAKTEIEEIVEFLKNPKRYTDLGGKIPKGALLVGPPGTGKTLLAKAVAGEANVPFFSMSGSDFVEMFVGVGASRVRDLFRQAKEKAPCIVFIDEIDAVGRARGRNPNMGSNDERENTLNQLLTEMDGFDATKGLVILAATNRPESLDKALLRPGRFDRRIIMELPDLAGRKAILQVHLRHVKHGDIDLDAVGRATAGSSGADIANIVNEAALRAVRLGEDEVSTADLEESVETVIAGEQKKGAVIAPEEKRVISYHEIGHAMVAACQSHSAPVQKITIIPRTSGALGYTMQVDSAEKHLMSRDEMLNRIATLCGGRAAEEVMCHTCTTGASNDIEKATQLARAMITTYGMSEKYGMMQLEKVTNQYLGGNSSLTCSAETARDIDIEVRDIISQAHDKAVKIITSHAKQMDEAAAVLLKKETITGQEFMQIVEPSL